MKISDAKKEKINEESNIITFILRICAIVFFCVYLVIAFMGSSYDVILSGMIVSLGFIVVAEIIQILHDIRRKIYSKK